MSLPRALSELDKALAEQVALRAKLADRRGELDNVYALLRSSSAQCAALAVEMVEAHAEREQLRDSVEAATALVAELTRERSSLRRRVEELSGQFDDLRAAAYQRQ